ncbi:MAG: phosphohydrolase [Planctomycetes bacterium]|nr:phosphohydrolase [Planctomycetota bacterium]
MNTTLVSSLTSGASFLAGLYALRLFPDRRMGVPRVLLAALAVVACAGGVAAYLVFRRGSFFLGVDIVYCAIAIPVPLLALVFLFLARARGATRLARLCAFAALGLAPVCAYATFVEPYLLAVERTRVPIAPHNGLTRPITIAVLSDMQMLEVTDHEREAVRLAMQAHPDLILIPGDMTQVGREHLEEIRGPFQELVAALAAPLGVFAVHGDCEGASDARRLLEGTRIRLLVDECVHLESGGASLWLCGLENGFGQPRSLSALAELDAHADSGELRLALAHRPDVVYTLAPHSRVDLLVCGHTHGGQVQLPFFGPPFVLSQVPRSVGAGGLHEIGGHKLYVSRGIGWEHGHAPRVRFNCRPEVSLLTLVPEGQP